jgi:hypothetical protein
MALKGSRRGGLGICLFLAAIPSIAQKPPDLTAILTQIEGQVTLSSGSVRRAGQRQVIHRGELVHVPASGQVTLICSTEALVRLTGAQDWTLDATGCRKGVQLPPSSYRNLASYAGRMISKNGIFLLELETRNVEMGLGPILLSPRNTAVKEARPLLVWTRVPDAIQYEIEIRGPVGISIRLAADDLHCGHGAGVWRDLDVCSWTPSDKWPGLDPERPTLIKLGSRPTLASPFRQIQEIYSVRLLSENDRQSLQKDLGKVASFPVDKISRLLLTAGAFVQAGLYSDAVSTYDEALREQEMPEARVTLGDLLLALGLAALAEHEYGQVLMGDPVPPARAAAELGLGQAAYIRKHFSDARAHFERASALYASLGLEAEAAAARKAAIDVQDDG